MCAGGTRGKVCLGYSWHPSSVSWMNRYRSGLGHTNGAFVRSVAVIIMIITLHSGLFFIQTYIVKQFAWTNNLLSTIRRQTSAFLSICRTHQDTDSLFSHSPCKKAGRTNYRIRILVWLPYRSTASFARQVIALSIGRQWVSRVPCTCIWATRGHACGTVLWPKMKGC